MKKYSIDRCCEHCSMGEDNSGAWCEADDVEAAISAIVDHLWDKQESFDLKGKSRLEAEIRGFFA